MEYAHPLADDEKRELLRIARATLREHTYSGRIPPGKPHRDALCAPAGVFVGLYHREALRGCHGTRDTKPLYRIVQEMAVAASTRDSRFAPVMASELDHLTIELTVLGISRPVTSPTDITIGDDGLWIEVDGKHGISIPQLAVSAGWDPLTLLFRTCEAAGLAGHAWQDTAARLRAFKAQIFSDITHPKVASPGGI